jgi:hypothetical protein
MSKATPKPKLVAGIYRQGSQTAYLWSLMSDCIWHDKAKLLAALTVKHTSQRLHYVRKHGRSKRWPSQTHLWGIEEQGARVRMKQLRKAC